MPNQSLIQSIRTLHPDVEIIMASKYLTPNDFESFIQAGITQFGESRVEALEAKLPVLQTLNVSIHFLGTLQTKKVKKIINAIDCLHSLDRLKLAKEINKRRLTPLKCFIQVNISNESQKHGLSVHEVEPFLNALSAYSNIEVIGLMGMGELTDDQTVIKKQFDRLKTLKDTLNQTYPTLNKLSMGMSNDYKVALSVGTTHLRLGRILLDGGYDEKEKTKKSI